MKRFVPLAMALFVLFPLTAAGEGLPSAAPGDGPARDHVIVPEDYFTLATITACSVSPKGHYAAYVESRWGEGKEGRKNDLWVVELDTKKRTRLTFDGFGAAHPLWSPDEGWIYFTGKTARPGAKKPPFDGTVQVFRVSPEGGEPFPVTREKDGVKGFDLARDGKTLYYLFSKKTYAPEWKALREKYAGLRYGHGVTRFNGIKRLDLEGWRTKEVLAPKRVIHEMALSPRGDRIALITTEDEPLIYKEGWSRVDVLDLASGKVETVTPEGWRKGHPSPFGWLENLAWSGDGDALAFTISFDGYATRIYVNEWVGGTAPALYEVTRPGITACDGALAWRGKERTLCFRGEEKARLRIYAVQDVKDRGQGETKVLTPGDVVVGALGFSRGGERLVAVVETVTHTGDLFLVKEDGGLDPVTRVNPQVDRWKLPKIGIFSWAGADGDPVEGILELPPDYEEGSGPLPLVVEIHGGPTSSTKYRFRLWIYGRALMASRGFALLSPNYHGSTGYGDAFTSKLVGRENDIEVKDILTGIEALVKKGIADRDHIGVMGWSNGGYLTNCVITAAPDLFKAASSGAGILDMVIQWGTEDTPGHVVNFMQGLPWQNPEAYRKASPLYRLDRVKTPTLIHVGGADARVPPAHSKALYRALHHYLHVPVELVIYPGEPHGLTTHEHRLAKMKWDLAWFDKYLGPGRL